jgi:hypothetical protein
VTAKWLAAAFAGEVVVLAMVGLAALDIHAHKRVELLGGVNMWGYRGAVLHEKQPAEVRIAVVGGDLAFGWGVAADETLTAYLRRLVMLDLDRSKGTNRTVTAVNLGAQGLALPEYAGWLQRFAYLHPDVICIVADPGTHALRDGRFLPDRRSLVFSNSGYSPILPLVLQERSAIGHSKTIRAAGQLLAAADISAPAGIPPGVDAARSLRAAADAAMQIAPMGVVVVLPPDDDGMRGAVAPGSRQQVVDLADNPALRGGELRLDGFHFGAGGHSRAAESIAPAVLQLVHAAESARR